MVRLFKTFGIACLLMTAYSTRALAQSTPASILELNVENIVNYTADVADTSKFATDTGVTAAATPRNFATLLIIGDIVAVNGQPAKGNFVYNARTVNLNPAGAPGQAIADLVHGNANFHTFEILKSDGTPVGSIMATGLGGAGSAAPGSPAS